MRFEAGEESFQKIKFGIIWRFDGKIEARRFFLPSGMTVMTLKAVVCCSRDDCHPDRLDPLLLSNRSIINDDCSTQQLSTTT